MVSDIPKLFVLGLLLNALSEPVFSYYLYMWL
ncbi:MAG: hypothetical protein RIS47_118 [Bacteroidota bacterium]|jgi:hypothetical protein